MKFITRKVRTGERFPISQSRARQARARNDDNQEEQDLKSVRPRQPAIHRLNRFRTAVLPMLLVLVFTTFILAAIYVYCVAKPHTPTSKGVQNQNGTTQADDSLFGKRSSSALLSRSTTTTSQDQDQDQQSSSQQSDLTSLLFYSLTTPAVSLIHLSFELIMHYHHQTSDHPAIKQQNLSLGLDLAYRRQVYFAVLAASSFLAAGWVPTLAFWMHCELPISRPDESESQSHLRAAQAACPAQVRGHFMYGIHEVSIAKVVLGWIIVLGYVCHVVLLALALKPLRRIWRLRGGGGSGSGSGDGGSLEHGDASEVVIRIEEEEEEEEEEGGKSRL